MSICLTLTWDAVTQWSATSLVAWVCAATSSPKKIVSPFKSACWRFLSSEVFPSILKITQNTFEDNGLSERALGKTQVTSIFWVISKVANEVGCQCKNCTFSNLLFSYGLNVISLYESWVMVASSVCQIQTSVCSESKEGGSSSTRYL